MKLFDNSGNNKAQVIRPNELATALNCSPSTIWRWVSRGTLPKPQKIGNRFTYWFRSELETALASFQMK